MARRSRQHKHTSSAASELASPFIQRQLGFFELLGEEQMQVLDRQVDWMFENIGFAFTDNPAALEVWKKAGVKVSDGRVFADAQFVREQVQKAPEQFTQRARNPERNVVIGGRNQVFAPIYGAPFVRDLEGGRRYASFADFEKLLKLT